jgi:hypothetical protein
MHYSDYRNISGLGFVYDPKWKPLHEASPNSAVSERTTNTRMGKDFGQRTFDLSDEVCT